MSKRNFHELLEARWAESKFACVGLDSECERIPHRVRASAVNDADGILFFNRKIVDETKDLVCAYKPNFAFYEAIGDKGLVALASTMEYIREKAPGVPVILDAKRADIGKTNVGSVKMAFNYLKADAITVNPYLGAEALQPFLEMKDRGVIVLCRTSNPGAGEFQDLFVCVPDEEGEFLRKAGVVYAWHPGAGFLAPLYLHIAYRVSRHWNTNGNCALVVGATYPEELGQVRRIVGDMPILIPGIGTQGGDLEKTIKAGKDGRNRGMIINSSSGLIFPKSEDPRKETLKLHESINQYR